MFVALILVLFSVVSTFVLIRIWIGKPPARRSRLRDENFVKSGTLLSYEGPNLSVKGVMSALVPGVALIWEISIAGLLINEWPRNHSSHEAVGLLFLLAAISLALSVPLYLRGRPRALVPPPFRKYWDESKGL